MNRTLLMATTGLIAATVSVLTPASAVAQDTAAGKASSPGPGGPSSSSVGEVVVTARRQAERLQDVPLAVTALTSQVLTQAGVEKLSDAAALTPGLLIAKTSSESGVSPLGGGGVIRGIADVSGAGNPTVGVFLNGVSLTNANAVSLGIIGMQRIEIIKGPVTALYGRGAFAGAINYVTNDPTNTVTGHITGQVGNGGEYAVYGDINGPIIKDVLDVGLAGTYDKFDGTYTDQVNGLHAGGHEKKDFRASFLFTPTDKLRVFGGYYRGDDQFNVAPQVHADNNCGAFNAARPIPGTQFNYYCGLVTVPHPVEVAAINSGANQAANARNVQIADLHATYDFGFATASIIGGYTNVRQVGFQDFTTYRNGIPFTLTPGPGTVTLLELFGSQNNNEDASVEFRLASKQDQRFRWAVGGYYFHDRNFTSTLVGVDGSQVPAGQTIGGFAGTFVTSHGQFSNAITSASGTDEQISPFGSAEFDLFRGLTVFGEVRETNQYKTFHILSLNTVPNTPNPLGAAGIGGGRFVFTNYRTGLRYKLNEEVNVYATVATGEKAGGFNQRATLAADLKYAPETNTTYEVGLKTLLFDNKLLFNAAAFYIKDNGLQVSGPSTDPKNPGLVTTNYGNIVSKGFELESQFALSKMITLSGSVAYADPIFQHGAYNFSPPSADYISGVASCAAIASCASRLRMVPTPAAPAGRRAETLEGLQAPFTSKWIYNAGVNFHGMFMNDYAWFSRLEYRYESKRFNSVDNIFFVGSRNNVDVSAGISKGPVELIAYVDNLTNDQTPLYTFVNARLTDFGGTFVSNLPDARQYGLRLTFSYK